MIHLEPAQLEIVQKLLREHLPDCEVWAFGSRVHGRRLEKFSDLDLAVVSGAPVDVMRLQRLREAFSESDLPIRVDVVDLTQASPGFRAAVEAERELVSNANT